MGNCFSCYKESDRPKNPNVMFYRNQIPAYPNQDYIDSILLKWPGDYEKLERNHFYIQWLFPNRKPGVNKDAYILSDEEADIIKNDPVLLKKVKAAFEMMLDFYGMKLTENRIKLTDTWEERIRELNVPNNHNFLRITRILLCLKELGHKKLMLLWMKAFAELIYEKKALHFAESSFENYWFSTLDSKDVRALEQYIKKL